MVSHRQHALLQETHQYIHLHWIYSLILINTSTVCPCITLLHFMPAMTLRMTLAECHGVFPSKATHSRRLVCNLTLLISMVWHTSYPAFEWPYLEGFGLASLSVVAPALNGVSVKLLNRLASLGWLGVFTVGNAWAVGLHRSPYSIHILTMSETLRAFIGAIKCDEALHSEVWAISRLPNTLQCLVLCCEQRPLYNLHATSNLARLGGLNRTTSGSCRA